jgi:predicted DNA-binding protein (MmcQ/YjbR family)
MTGIDQCRQLCMSLPEAREQEAWGEPTFRVGRKIFAMFASGANHHGGGRDSLWCKAPIGLQEVLLRSDEEKFYIPPYVGVKGWIGIRLDAVGEAELRSLIVQSYCLIAPRRLQAKVTD